MIQFRPVIILTLFLLNINLGKAQDKLIFRSTSDTLLVKVVEVGTEKITYKLWPVSDDFPLIEERTSRLKKIIFSNGQQMKFYEDGFSDPGNYANQRKMAIKIAPFGLLVAQTGISFEKSIKPGRSYEYSIHGIGLGLSRELFGNPSGITLKSGYKFINTPDYYIDGMRYMHILKGSYIKPEVIGTYYQILNDNYIGLAGMLNFGKQWVFDDAMCVDLYAGVGLGYKNTLSDNNSNSVLSDEGVVIPYGFVYVPSFDYNGFNPGVRMCFSFGLRVGYLLKNSK
ncbi:MAG: hypothetical protein LCH37_01610 [Bacteroidetes bacterium]|nr:hypothetical protein [Bacteroidota bacterium]